LESFPIKKKEGGRGRNTGENSYFFLFFFLLREEEEEEEVWAIPIL